MPATRWRVGDLVLDIAAFGAGTPDAAQAIVRYTVRNVGKRTLAGWHSRSPGGPSRRIRRRNSSPIAAAPARSRPWRWDGGALWVNGALRLKAAAAAEQRSRRACCGRAGRRLARAGAAGRARDERQRSRRLRERRAALRHAASLLARTGPSTSSCRSRRMSLARKRRRRPRSRPASRRTGVPRSTGSASTAPARWPTSPGRCAPPSATSSSTAAARPCSRARGPMRDRGFETAR